jgi:hypothetical protein
VIENKCCENKNKKFEFELVLYLYRWEAPPLHTIEFIVGPAGPLKV